jgi:hypothetical protein
VRRLQGYAIGSYYKLGSPQAGLNANPMRGLVYLVTNQRKEPIPSSIQHPLHPSKQMVRLETPQGSYAYAADIVAVHERDVRAALGVTRPNIALVPVPAANIVRVNRTTDRWPSRDFAAELERLGFGKVRPCVVNKDAMRPRFSFEEDPAHDTAQNLVIIGRPQPNEAVVYVDDIVASGDRISAVDQALGQPAGAGIVAVSLAEEKTRHDAYRTRTFTLTYEPGATATTPWKVNLL